MTKKDREGMERQIHKLKKAIQRLVVSSREFAGLRKLLREGQFELQIYLIPMAPGGSKSKERLRLELTAEDRRFLKKAGIRF